MSVCVCVFVFVSMVYYSLCNRSLDSGGGGNPYIQYGKEDTFFSYLTYFRNQRVLIFNTQCTIMY